MISKNIFALLMTCLVLVSCNSVERKAICGAVTSYQIEENEACIVSIQHNACLCAKKFDFNSWSENSKFRVEPLEYCEGLMGVNKDFALREIQPKFIALQRLRESSCKPRTNKGQENVRKLLHSKDSSTLTTTQKMNEVDGSYSHSSDFGNPVSKDN